MQATRNDGRGAWIAVGILLLVLLVLPLVGGGMMGAGWMGPGWMRGYAGGADSPWRWLSMLPGLVGMVAFWAVVVAAIVLGARALGRSGPPTERGETAMDVLDRRFAAGEITAEQYQEMRRTLRGG